MPYKLPRAIITKEMTSILKREIQKQGIEILKAPKTLLKQLKKIQDEVLSHETPLHLVRCKLPGALGHGIFLHPNAKPIKKDQLIGPYSGFANIVWQNEESDSCFAFAPITDMHLTKDEQKIFDSKRKFHPARRYAFDVDADKEGNFIRFVNHSNKPNVSAHLYSVGKNDFDLTPSIIEVFYLASKTIKPGEQLLVNYEGDDGSYWDSLGIKPLKITPQTFTLDSNGQLITKN